MKLPFSWLKEFVDVDITPEELETKLFSCGFEVEELIRLSEGISRVVVGEITHMEKQEGTDHLYLCRVNCGPEYGEDLAITTGAPNIFEGAIVPIALDGATLPGGIVIKARKMHGIMSNGMMCSGTELGITDDMYPGAEVNGLLILNGDPNAVLGRDICEVVGLDDVVFDISITANRPDCQSILGLAREVAALLDKPLHMPATDYEITGEPDPEISVRVEAPDLCPRYLAHYVRNLRIAESPRWMKRHLALMGLRSINNIVDITNHTLLEIGQPMHAFDLDHVEGKSICVRRAAEGEKITTLDEKEFTLNPNNLVICDAKKPVALAGIMGGLNSEIEADTKELLFECATFARDCVRKTSRALGQVSDSSSRYEKGVDQFGTELGLRRALHLIQELDCGDITPTAFDCSAAATHECMTFKARPEQINRVLGIEVPAETMIDILKRLQFGIEDHDGEWTVTVPRFREDIEGVPDLAEEVIREYGYDHIVPTFLARAAVTNGGMNDYQKRQMALKNTLSGQGFHEAMTLSFYSPADLDRLHIPADAPERNAIRILNPLSENLSIMRTTLAPSMLTSVVENLKSGNSEGRLFELANVYIPYSLPLDRMPDERLTLCLGVFGPEEDFFTVKGVMEAISYVTGVPFTYERAQVSYLHPGMTAAVIAGGRRIGVFGKLANDVTEELSLAKDDRTGRNIYLAELDYGALDAMIDENYHYVPLNEYAEQKRDLALICDEKVTVGEIEECIRQANPLVAAVRLFDVYRGKNIGEGRKSMAFTVTLSDREKDVTDNAAQKAVHKILSNLKFKLGAELRQE